MQLEETKKKGLARGYKLTITAADLEAKVIEKLEQSRGDIQIKGFRKGNVPIALLKKMYGKSMLGEVMQESVDEAVREHFVESGDKPAMQPEIKILDDNWKEGNDMNVGFEYEKLPEIPKTDFSQIKLDKLVTKIDKKSVDEALTNLASSAPDFKPRNKAGKAKSGDQVVIDFEGTVDSVAFDGGKAEEYPLIIGSNSFIPGFETQLVGVKSEEKKEVKVTFPEEYGNKELAGKEAIFAVNVKLVNEPTIPKINDELAKKFGAENLKGLKDQITERLKDEFSVASKALLKRKLMDAIEKSVKFEVPSKLLDNEAKEIAHQLWHEENPDVKDHNHTHIEPTKEHIKIAKRRVKLGLLLADLGSKNKITVSEQETQSALMEKARDYPGQEKAFFEFVEKNPQAREQVRAPIFEDKVIDFILELANVSEKLVSKDDLKKAVDKLESA